MTRRTDRLVPGLGRVRLPTGARTSAEHRKRLDLFDQLIYDAQTATIQAMLDKRLTWTDLIHADRQGKLLQVADRLIFRQNLWSAVEAQFNPKQVTERRYLESFRALRASGALGPKASIEDIARVDWRALERRWTAGASDWNHLRRAVSRLFSKLTFQSSDFWRAIGAKFPLRKETARHVVASLPQLVELLSASPERDRPHLRALLATGMRPGEAQKFTPAWLEPQYVLHIWGTKNAPSNRSLAVDPRIWPTLVEVAELPKGDWRQKALARELAVSCRAVGMAVLQLRDLRHCYRQLCAEAGIPEGVAEYSMGHSISTIRQVYSRAPWLASHGRKFADHVDCLFPSDPTILPMRRAQ